MKRIILLSVFLLTIGTGNAQQATCQGNYCYDTQTQQQQNYQSQQQQPGNYSPYSSQGNYSAYTKNTGMARDALNTFQDFSYTVQQTVDMVRNGFNK